MHCGPPNQNFGWVMAHPAHAAAPPITLTLNPNFGESGFGESGRHPFIILEDKHNKLQEAT